MKTSTAADLAAPSAVTVDGDENTEPTSVGDRLRHLLGSEPHKEPLYPRLLQLRNVHPNGWQRALLVEGMALLGGIVALADRATAWAPVILPVGAAMVVKFHDVLAGALPRRASATRDADVTAPHDTR
jgi:hypothetical protein